MLASSQSFIFKSFKDSGVKLSCVQELAMVIRIEGNSDWLEIRDERPAELQTSPQQCTIEAPKQDQPRVNVDDLPNGTLPFSTHIRWNMVFIWQAPTMMMAYSIIGFLIGLIVYITTPLYDGSPFDGPSKVEYPW